MAKQKKIQEIVFSIFESKENLIELASTLEDEYTPDNIDHGLNRLAEINGIARTLCDSLTELKRMSQFLN